MLIGQGKNGPKHVFGKVAGIMTDVMPRKTRTGSDFGERLIALRKERDLTQVQLAEAIGSTQRAISYYENEASYPPAPVVADLAKALDLSVDELMGLKQPRAARATKRNDDPDVRRLWKKFQRLLTLPEKDQRAVMRLVNSLVTAKGK